MKGLSRLNASARTESERSWKSKRESKEGGRVQDIWRDDRAVVKQQINTSILLALSFSAAKVEKSADREEQIVWESRDQYGKQLPFDSPFSHNDFASISCWSSITCQWKSVLSCVRLSQCLRLYLFVTQQAIYLDIYSTVCPHALLP